MDLYYLWYFEVEAQASLPPPRYAPAGGDRNGGLHRFLDKG